MLYAFAGYPIVLRILNFVRPSRKVPDSSPAGRLPSISFILVVHNEESRISRRILNLAESNYAGECELVLVCDGCSDDTASKARAIDPGFPIRILEQIEQRGKAAALNLAAELATGEILIFGDGQQRFAPEAADKLVERLRSTPEAAAVSGCLMIEPSVDRPAAGIDLYWRL